MLSRLGFGSAWALCHADFRRMVLACHGDLVSVAPQEVWEGYSELSPAQMDAVFDLAVGERRADAASV